LELLGHGDSILSSRPSAKSRGADGRRARRSRLSVRGPRGSRRAMRAIVVEGPSQDLVIGDVPRPEVAPERVLVEVHATAVNRADLLQRRGFYPPPPGESDVLGLEAAGVVAEI